MTVLTLAGKKINWNQPPKATDRVRWSKVTVSGQPVIGSLRTIAHLDHLDALAKKKFGSGVVVMQPPYNKGVEQSEGTHDFDACLDVFIPNVGWAEQQSFFRANGCGAYYRRPPVFTSHIHYFTLPPRRNNDVREDFREGGFKVGKYVDGGYSTLGHLVASAQIEDYYAHRNALEGHAHDPSWFPANIAATIFDLHKYIVAHQPKRLAVSMINIPFKVGRENWEKCWRRAQSVGDIFGVNESFHDEQRALYASLVREFKGRIAQAGLMSTPNPVFWRTDLFAKVSAKVYRIHPKNTEAPNHAKWPGFYDARYITEVVLRPRHGGREIAFLNTHLAAEVKVIDQRWLRKVKRLSKAMLRDLVRKHKAAGRVVVVVGDMNTTDDFAMPRGFRWLTKNIIDKIGANRRGSASTFDAPTDHKHGVRANIRL